MLDIFKWKFIPSKIGGGISYIQRFKNGWVVHNRETIKHSATEYKIPPYLLAGVCWIEVGGDPHFIDRVAFEIRSLDWSVPSAIDKHLTVTSPPEKTSFGPVSMQVRTAAQTLELELESMSDEDVRALVNCLQQDNFNIRIAARHLRQLAEHDGFGLNISMEQAEIVGARYNRGLKPTIDSINKNKSYGKFITHNRPHFERLLIAN